MPSGVFNTQRAQEGSDNWSADTIRIALVGTGYVFDPDADTMTAALGANEAAGTGYARRTLAAKSIVKDDALDETRYAAGDVVYSGANFGTVKGGIVYRDPDGTDSDATNVPVAYCEFATPVTTNGGDFTFQFASGAVFKAA